MYKRKIRATCRRCSATENIIRGKDLCTTCTRVHALMMKWGHRPEDLKRNIEHLKHVISVEESILKGINPITGKEIKKRGIK